MLVHVINRDRNNIVGEPDALSDFFASWSNLFDIR